MNNRDRTPAWANTSVSAGFTARLGRGIKNRLVDAMSAPGVEILPCPLQRLLMRNVSAATEKSGRQELIPMWSGQGANRAHHTMATGLLETPVSGVSVVMNDTSAAGGKDAAL